MKYAIKRECCSGREVVNVKSVATGEAAMVPTANKRFSRWFVCRGCKVCSVNGELDGCREQHCTWKSLY